MRHAIASGFTWIAVGAAAVVLLTLACSDATAPPVASQLAFTIQPGTAAAGVSMPVVAVSILSADGKTVTSAKNLVNLEVYSPLGVGLIGITNVEALDGVATFRELSINTKGTGFSLVASSDALGIAISASFEVTFGPAARLVFTSQPTFTGVGTAIAPAVRVTVQDAFDNVVTTATNNVTLAMNTSGNGAVLSGTTTVAAVNGIASFSDLTTTTACASCTLAASAPNLAGATSTEFEVRNPIIFAAISSGYFHTCGVATDGAAYCWGDNAEAQLGATRGSTLARAVNGGFTFANVSSGRTHTCGSTMAGAGYCWGGEGSGALGIGGTKALQPTLILGGLSFATVAAGYSHSCGVTTAGVGYCWGDNIYGELGSGIVGQGTVPQPVLGGLVFSNISPGREFTCGLTTTGAAYCWGENSLGEVGDGTNVLRNKPVPVAGQITFAVVRAGGFHACGLTPAGAAYCWGDRTDGKLGDGVAIGASAVPVAVSGGLTFATISVGNRHTCAVTTGGAAYCWGENSTGHLGTGTINPSSVPVAVVGGLAFSSVSAGRFHTCGVTTAGAGYCWGNNAAGKLGDGTVTNSFVPVKVR